MRNKYYTFKVYFTDGSMVPYYCRKEDLLDRFSAREFLRFDHAEIWNNGTDNVNHRRITKSDLEKMA